MSQLTLISEDHQEVLVDRATITTYSSTIKDVCDSTTDPRIPLQRVKKDILDLILQFVNLSEQNKDESEEKIEEEMQKWSQNFGDKQLYDVFVAANFLVMESLLNHISDVIAEKYVRWRPVEEIRERFGIENDFTPEEEEQIKKENQDWFEGSV